jgi:hypothetical protein
MDGLGSLTGAVLLAVLGLRRGFGRVFLGGSLLGAVGVVLLGLVRSWPTAVPVLWLLGLGVSGFATMQTTIAATVAAPEMRGRAMGAISLAIGTLPFGMFWVGFVADRIGAPEALLIHALLGIAVIGLLAASQPALRRL